MINMAGKTVLISGGSRGIGKAAALLFAEAGCDVALNYALKKWSAEEVKAQIEKMGKKCLIYKCDVSAEKEVESMVESIMEEWGRIDCLVNNAGIWTYGEMGEMGYDVWSETMRINLDGVFFLCSFVVPVMKEQRSGNIVNVSSTAAVRGESLHSHYAASKGAINSLTKSLAVELASYGIRVNCVTPGWTDTDMCTEVFQDEKYRRKVENSIPLGRVATSFDIAGPILFLASDLARHITGEILNVNGGSVLCG